MDMIKPREIYCVEDSIIPNNPALPVLLYRKVLGPRTANKDKIIENHFAQSGWTGIWKNGIYDYHHFHSNAHEALGIARGHVEVQIGGQSGKTLSLRGGDIIVLPAGTGHKRMGSSRNLIVVGAYPPGQEDHDMCCNLHECPQARDRIARVPVPLTDPFYGVSGPLPLVWAKAG